MGADYQLATFSGVVEQIVLVLLLSDLFLHLLCVESLHLVLHKCFLVLFLVVEIGLFLAYIFKDFLLLIKQDLTFRRVIREVSILVTIDTVKPLRLFAC